MAKREQNRDETIRKIVQTLRRHGPKTPNAALVRATGRSIATVRRYIKMIDTPSMQRLGLEPTDTDRSLLERYLSKPMKHHDKWRVERQIFLVSKLDDDLGAKRLALAVDDLGQLRPGDQEEVVRDLGCSPTQFQRWLRRAEERGYVKPGPSDRRSGSPTYLGTGVCRAMRHEIIAQVRGVEEREAASGARSLLSSDEDRLLKFVSDRENGPLGYCDARLDEIATFLGKSERAVQDLYLSLEKAGRLHRKRYEKGHHLRPGQFLSTKPLSPEQVHDLTLRVVHTRAQSARGHAPHGTHGRHESTDQSPGGRKDGQGS